MGDDKDIVTISFVVRDKDPAKDLVRFIEGGYEFVLDADETDGEQEDAKYRVFVELERTKDAIDQIVDILDGVGKLADVDNWRFRYHKKFRSNNASREELEGEIPTDPDAYLLNINESTMDNYKNFFNRSFVDSIELMDDILTIRKIYSQPISFRVLDFGDSVEMNEAITESLNFNDWAEIIYLTKYLGDYNISKYGQKLTIENEGKTLVLNRL